jgi:hypothetical protein
MTPDPGHSDVSRYSVLIAPRVFVRGGVEQRETDECGSRGA